LPKISTLHQHYQNIVNMLPSFDALTDLQKRSDMAAEHCPASLPAPINLQEGVFFEGVSFRYVNSDSKWILNHIDLFLKAHAMTAIVGSSGAGKSTLADLLIGLLRPENGVIRIDDTILDGSVLHAWRGCIGYVPQETFLFHDTIRANLKWADPNAGDQELKRALKLAAADRFIRKLPAGMDTIVGDRGVRLSGGERQRIALARALLHRPSLLLLDEATSSLDRENERSIQQAIDNLHGELTIVVIAHRLSTIRNADNIVVLDEGRIAETGSWEKLVGSNGRFRAMLDDDGFACRT
jgi:ATP-binding cassette subfamily C protein